MDLKDKKLSNYNIIVKCQRCGRISRTFQGKTRAIVYDYIFDFGMCYYQFYNRNKRNYRLKAYLECTIVPPIVIDLVTYLQAYARGKSLTAQQIPHLANNFDEVVIEVDSLPQLKVDLTDLEK